MSDDACYSPCRGGVLRGKGGSSLKEVPCAVSLEWPLPAQRVLQRLNRNQGVERSLPREQASFAPVLIAGMATSVLGMAFRYMAHLQQKKEIEKTKARQQ